MKLSTLSHTGGSCHDPPSLVTVPRRRGSRPLSWHASPGLEVSRSVRSVGLWHTASVVQSGSSGGRSACQAFSPWTMMASPRRTSRQQRRNVDRRLAEAGLLERGLLPAGPDAFEHAGCHWGAPAPESLPAEQAAPTESSSAKSPTSAKPWKGGSCTTRMPSMGALARPTTAPLRAQRRNMDLAAIMGPAMLGKNVERSSLMR
mmetsp:Transcript_88601/g.251159  ORF Transcript_88601/g.251159 Transcript_88601/m.251159 type:complete len:203 (+) Transcript_88601:76-684(+)